MPKIDETLMAIVTKHEKQAVERYKESLIEWLEKKKAETDKWIKIQPKDHEWKIIFTTLKIISDKIESGEFDG
jgi:hypothetical protein